MNTTPTPPSKPRFSPWPYAILGFFVVFVTCVAGFITWASRQDMDLVRQDYYEHEILFQQHIDRQRRTAELGSLAGLDYDAAKKTIAVKVPALPAITDGAIHFYRPSDAKLDHEVRLAPGTDGLQQVDATKLRSGLWKIAVQWSSEGREYYLERPIVIGG